MSIVCCSSVERWLMWYVNGSFQRGSTKVYDVTNIVVNRVLQYVKKGVTGRYLDPLSNYLSNEEVQPQLHHHGYNSKFLDLLVHNG